MLAVVGLVFGYFIVLPAALNFLLDFDSGTFSNNLAGQAVPHASAPTSLLAMAVVFELPLFVVALTRLGIIKTDQLRRNRRIGYFLVVCIAVALPGVDPVTDDLRDAAAARPLRDARSGSPSCSTAAPDA